MKITLKEQFLSLWKKYFGDSELPLTFFYSEGSGGAEPAPVPKGRTCLICSLSKVRNGKSIYFNESMLSCGGARRYLGYTDKMRRDFEYFLSCGNEEMEGERYLQTPEMAKVYMKIQKTLPAQGRNIVFKRWDKLTEDDNPDVVIFFAKPDVLSGLFTLANFDQTEPNGTICPFGAGCGTIVHYPYLESLTDRQRAVIGMFDPSARPCVQENIITFAVPMKRFERMTGFMEESFLITPTWNTLKKRL